MKRPTRKSRKWHAIHARRSDHRRLLAHRRRQKRRAVIQRRTFPFQISRAQSNLRTSDRGYFLDLPHDLSLSRNYHETARVLGLLRQFVHSRTHRLRSLNFNNIEDIAPTACLVLAAELDRWDESVRRRLQSKASEWDPVIAQLFYEMGLFDLLGKRPPAHCTDPKLAQRIFDQQFIRFTTGISADGSFARALREALESLVGPIARQPLYEGLTEAMTNVIHHAYPDEKDRQAVGGGSRWWLSGGIDRRNNTLTVSIYDQGVTIPRTLPHSTHWERILGYLSRLGLSNRNDAHMIRGAMEVGRTATGLSHQGKGLPQMRNFIDTSGSGHVRILSRYGEYQYKRHGASQKVSLNSHQVPIRGTIIEWCISVNTTEGDRDAKPNQH